MNLEDKAVACTCYKKRFHNSCTALEITVESINADACIALLHEPGHDILFLQAFSTISSTHKVFTWWRSVLCVCCPLLSDIIGQLGDIHIRHNYVSWINEYTCTLCFGTSVPTVNELGEVHLLVQWGPFLFKHFLCWNHELLLKFFHIMMHLCITDWLAWCG